MCCWLQNLKLMRLMRLKGLQQQINYRHPGYRRPNATLQTGCALLSSYSHISNRHIFVYFHLGNLTIKGAQYVESGARGALRGERVSTASKLAMGISMISFRLI